MTTTIIISFCILILVSYLFDLTSSKTKIPTVILLLLMGLTIKQFKNYFDIDIPDLTPALPIFGTIGLILIVLEGALELELNKQKKGLIGKSFLVALLPMLLLAFILVFILQQFGETDLKKNLINIIPLCIISSAIAIPSIRSFSKKEREFVIYESSLSDILGVLFFNFVTLNQSFTTGTIGYFSMEIIIMIIASFILTLALAFLLKKIDHHIKFIPIILLVILIYYISKIYHLPGLIFILIFGIFLGNLDELKKFKWVQKLKPEELKIEVSKFKELATEGAFLIRTIFFLLFGYLIEMDELLNTDSLILSLGIVFVIFLLRMILLLVLKLPVSPLVFIAPRGLITILLFLSIAPENAIPAINKSLIIQVILITSIILLIGNLSYKKQSDQ